MKRDPKTLVLGVVTACALLALTVGGVMSGRGSERQSSIDGEHEGPEPPEQASLLHQPGSDIGYDRESLDSELDEPLGTDEEHVGQVIPQKFPHFGGLEVLPGRTLRAVMEEELDFGDTVAVSAQLQLATFQLGREALQENLSLRGQLLSHEEAVQLSDSDVAVLESIHPRSGEKVYLRCPTEHLSELEELHATVRTLVRSPAFIDGISADVLDPLRKAHPGEVYMAVERADGTGLDFVDSDGSVVASHYLSIPGRIR